MRIVGKLKLRQITLHASSELLKAGCAFNDELHKLPTGNRTFIPKGLYHFKSHEEANRHWDECVAKGMAEIALERRRSGSLKSE